MSIASSSSSSSSAAALCFNFRILAIFSSRLLWWLLVAARVIVLFVLEFLPAARWKDAVSLSNCIHAQQYYLYIIIGLWKCVATRVAYMDGRSAGDERRPAAGRNRGPGLWRASQNGDVTPVTWLKRVWLTRANGRAGGYKQSRCRGTWRLVAIVHVHLRRLLKESNWRLLLQRSDNLPNNKPTVSS